MEVKKEAKMIISLDCANNKCSFNVSTILTHI